VCVRSDRIYPRHFVKKIFKILILPGLPSWSGFRSKDGLKAFTFHVIRDRHTCQTQQAGCKINVEYHLGGPSARSGYKLRISNDEWDPDGFLICPPLVHQLVFSPEIAVVAGIGDDRIV